MDLTASVATPPGATAVEARTTLREGTTVTQQPKTIAPLIDTFIADINRVAEEFGVGSVYAKIEATPSLQLFFVITDPDGRSSRYRLYRDEIPTDFAVWGDGPAVVEAEATALNERLSAAIGAVAGVPVPVPVKRTVNLTPHAVALCDEDGTVTRSWPSSGVARIVTNEGEPGADGVVPVAYGTIDGLPEPAELGGVTYIVSLVTLLALRGSRDDVVAPFSEVRDADGRIVGCRKLQRLA